MAALNSIYSITIFCFLHTSDLLSMATVFLSQPIANNSMNILIKPSKSITKPSWQPTEYNSYSIPSLRTNYEFVEFFFSIFSTERNQRHQWLLAVVSVNICEQQMKHQVIGEHVFHQLQPVLSIEIDCETRASIRYGNGVHLKWLCRQFVFTGTSNTGTICNWFPHILYMRYKLLMPKMVQHTNFQIGKSGIFTHFLIICKLWWWWYISFFQRERARMKGMTANHCNSVLFKLLIPYIVWMQAFGDVVSTGIQNIVFIL